MDEIVVSLPRERAFGAVAGLVLGGVAARHDLTLDVLDDLQLALETLLDQDAEDDGNVQIVLQIEDGAIAASVGPFDGVTLVELEQEAGETLGLRRLLDAVVDSVVVERRADGSWVELRKGYVAAGAA